MTAGPPQDAARHVLYRQQLLQWENTKATGCCASIRPLLWSDDVQAVSVVPFRLVGAEEGNDFHGLCGSGPLSPHWPLTPYKLSLCVDDAHEEFHTATAAYEAQKRWSNVRLRQTLAGAVTASDIAAAVEGAAASAEPVFDADAAMRRALLAKYAQPGQAECLLATTGSYLLCCSSEEVASTAAYWSDGNGWGGNRLGFALMELRDELAEKRALKCAWPAGLRRDRARQLLPDLARFCRAAVQDHEPAACR